MIAQHRCTNDIPQQALQHLLNAYVPTLPPAAAAHGMRYSTASRPFQPLCIAAHAPLQAHTVQPWKVDSANYYTHSNDVPHYHQSRCKYAKLFTTTIALTVHEDPRLPSEYPARRPVSTTCTQSSPHATALELACCCPGVVISGAELSRLRCVVCTAPSRGCSLEASHQDGEGITPRKGTMDNHQQAHIRNVMCAWSGPGCVCQQRDMQCKS